MALHNDFILSRKSGKIDMVIADDGDKRNDKWLHEAIKRGGKIYRLRADQVTTRTPPLLSGREWPFAPRALAVHTQENNDD